MNWEEKYEEWMESPYTPLNIKDEIQNSSKEILKERFEETLDFGTGGMRGKTGFGTNRMNVMVVRRVTFGLALYLKELNLKDKTGVVIQYDTRLQSREFAEEAASILAGQGIQVYLSDAPRPTPLLSYLVPKKKAMAGVMITASHNPPEYNGYKIYDSKGAQILPDAAKKIIEIFKNAPSETDIRPSEVEKHLTNNNVEYLTEKVEYEYIDSLQEYTHKNNVNIDGNKNLKVVYTPLHGAGTSLIVKALNSYGFNDVNIVKEQATYDGTFKTVKSPNPEETEAFTLAISKAQDIDADIILATDPDSDRIGVVSKTNNNEYEHISGNHLGALLINYLLTTRKGNKSKTVLKTIVTSDFGAVIAKDYGCNVKETLTGFKYIGEYISLLADNEKDDQFLFGYEESCGYLIYPLSRDKDAIQAAILIAEVALYYKKSNMTLIDALNELQDNYGYYSDYLHTISFENSKEKSRIEKNIKMLSESPPAEMYGVPVRAIENYQTGYRKLLVNKRFEKLNFPKSGVIKIVLENDSWIAVRLSGTENKCKLYFSAIGRTRKESQYNLEQMKKGIIQRYF